MAERTPVSKEHRDHWSDCGQVFFTGGTGYGLTNELQTIPLGKEVDILEVFNTGKMPDYLKPLQCLVLEGILEYRKEVGANATRVEVKRKSDFRSRPTRDIKHREANIRHAPPTKRVAIHKA